MFNTTKHFAMKKLLPLIFVTFISYSTFATSKPTTAIPAINDSPPLPAKETVTQSNPKTDSIDTSHTRQKDTSQKSKKVDEAAAYKKAIDDFKTFTLKTKPKIRQEINEYRDAIAKLEKQKIELYKRLTLEAQEFLAKEVKLKKALPIQTEEAKK